VGIAGAISKGQDSKVFNPLEEISKGFFMCFS